MKKSGVTAFVRVKNRTEKGVDIAVTFSHPVMESTLKSAAKEVLGKGYVTTDSYIRVRFDFKETPEDKYCMKFTNFLNQLDDEIFKAQGWTKSFEKALETR